MKPILTRVWSYLVNWFEHSDLVPLLVLVSAVHYAAVLAGKDFWLVAVAIGLLVDLGHYRTIRAAVRYAGASRWQAVLRWIIAIGMTGLSLNYHQRYYNDWWLSIPLPALIAALAWLNHVDNRSSTQRPAPAVKVDAPIIRALPSHTCRICGASFDKSVALASHVRWSHAKKEDNHET
jgi:hypothetical protein